MFKAAIADRPVWALLDTGFSSSMVDLEFARAAGFDIGSEEKTVNSVHTQFKLRLASEVPVLIPGQFAARYPQLPASDLGPISKLTGRKIDFVLGIEFMRPLALLIDPSRRMFTFRESGGFRPPPQITEINLQDTKIPLIAVMIGGERALVKIDTGSNGVLDLPSSVWWKVVPKNVQIGTSISTGADGRPYVQNTARVPEIELGTLKLQDVEVRELQGPQAQGLIGMRILGAYRLALDMKAGKLWLGPLTGKVSAEEPDAAAAP